ncbi:hypothetical protein NC651_009867 [Populus alba x Populus x berolinensis]|nr:hypothetical protein NC651_009867 [Populus alba x Populus x berolinensis]
MAKSKRKQATIVRRPHVPAPPSTTVLEIKPALDRLDVSPLPVNSSSFGGTNGPIPAVQRPSSSDAGANVPLVGSLEANLYNDEELGEDLEADAGPCPLCPAPHPLPPSSPHYVGPPQLASAMAVASGSKHLDVVLVEDFSDLDEDQLDFNFTDEECEDSPQAPVMLPAPHLSSPPPLLPAEQTPLLPKKVMSSAPISGSKEFAPPPLLQVNLPLLPATTNGEIFSVQVNLLTPAPNFKIFHLITFPKPVLYPQRISSRDLKFGIFVLWVMFLGKILASKRFKALQRIIATNWKCEATLTIHESGWLIYHFKSEEDKLAVLRGGPYLVYGRPLVLRQMTKYFDFSSAEMSRVPVWVKFPSLPLCCWSPVCLSKIASVIGKPIQCDQFTSNLVRMSYARVLVEIDLLEELRHNVKISLPEGSTLQQKIVYETLPKYCNFCHVLGHTRLLCSKAAATTSKVPCPQPQP